MLLQKEINNTFKVTNTKMHYKMSSFNIAEDLYLALEHNENIIHWMPPGKKKPLIYSGQVIEYFTHYYNNLLFRLCTRYHYSNIYFSM